MFIVLIENGECKHIETIIYGKEINDARAWVYNYLIKKIEDLENIAMKNTLGYKILENKHQNKYDIIKEYNELSKGYIYNSYNRKSECILTASILEYRDNQILNKKKFLQQYHQMLIEKGRNEIVNVVNTKEKRD